MLLHKLYKVKIKKKELLSKPKSLKKVYKIVLDTSDANISYRPGDCTGILAENDPKIVDLCIKYMGAKKEDKIYYQRKNNYFTLKDLLTKVVNISKATSNIINLLIEKIKDPKIKKEKKIFFQNEKNMQDYLKNHELWDILKDFNVTISAKEITQYLRPLLPRLYSISSFNKFYPNEIHLTVSYLSYTTSNIKRFGIASHFLCSLAKENSFINIYIQKTSKFLLPEDTNKNIIMIAAGTGIAPFIGFLQKRFFEKQKGKNWLFFGEQKKAYNFYYQDFLKKLEKENFLKLTTAFSRDQEQKIYVQHRILENSKKIWELIEQKTYIYICGSANMGKDVDKAFTDIIKKEGNIKNPTSYLSQMLEEKRYLKDVY